MGDAPKTFLDWLEELLPQEQWELAEDYVEEHRLTWNASRAALKAEALGVLREMRSRGREKWFSLDLPTIDAAIARIEKL